MKKSVALFGILALFAAVALIVSLAGRESKSPQAIEEHRFGVISVLSGEYAYIGQSWVSGIWLAHEQLSDLTEQSVKLFIEDDAFQASRGLGAYRKLTSQDRVQALLNLSTPTMKAIRPMVSHTNLPVLQWAEQDDQPQTDNIFQIQPSTVIANRRLGIFLNSVAPEHAILVYTEGDVNSREAEAISEGYGGEFEKYSVPAGETDFKTHALRILRNEPSHVVLVLGPTEMALLIKELLSFSGRQRPRLVLSAVFSIAVSSYETILGDLAPLANDLAVILKQSEDNDFRLEYIARFGEPPGIAAATGYDAFRVLLNTYDSDEEQWLENIRTFRGDGASGKIQFDEYGIRVPDTEILTIGEFLEKNMQY